MQTYTYVSKGKFELMEKPKPVLMHERDAVVKVTLASICSSDLHIMNNPVPVSLLSGDRKPQIRFLGNHHSGSGNLYHKSFRM